MHKPQFLGVLGFSAAMWIASLPAWAICPYDYNCLNNPYGAGNPYKPDGLMNLYSRYGSPYSNDSWTNPYATNAPKLYGQNGNYRGRPARIPTIQIRSQTPLAGTGTLTHPTASIIHMAQETPTRITKTTCFLGVDRFFTVWLRAFLKFGSGGVQETLVVIRVGSAGQIESRQYPDQSRLSPVLRQASAPRSELAFGQSV